MFGASEFDTTLIVEPNGDIRGVGQITMGENSSDGIQTTVLGFDNTGDGDSSTVGGGSGNVAQGTISIISGGHQNITTAEGATIGGGSFNQGDGPYSTVGGGQQNVASGEFATIAGGFGNTAAGDYSTVPGGDANSAQGFRSYAAGHRAKALHDGSFVWADQTDEDFVSTAPDQFIIRASGGFGIGTDNPVGLLQITGYDGDSSVNLPPNSVAAPEILDEPGLASTRSNQTINLVQGGSLQEMATVTINVPAPGYVLLRAGGVFGSSGSTSGNQMIAQIAEAPGGILEGTYTVSVGSGDHDSPNNNHYFSFSAERIYVKEVGSYTFQLEGMANPNNGASAIGFVENAYVTATYFPTSYGAVVEFVSSSEANSFETARYVGEKDVNVSSATELRNLDYQVDLRELELRVLEARVEAERAEKEYLRALIDADR
jgi:hypothetical protein